MKHVMQIALIAQAMGCAETLVGNLDAGAPTAEQAPAADALGDTFALDQGHADVLQPDVNSADLGPADAGTDATARDTAGLFTDAPLIGEGCNDLFPALPVRAVMHTEAQSLAYGYGEIPDGTYHLVRVDHYPSSSPRALFIGITVVVRGDTFQIASMGGPDQDFSRLHIRRSTCLVNRPMSPDTPLCSYSCTADLVGVRPFPFHEMRGAQLVLADVEDVYTYDRVAP